jgi:long-chain acyl-CoA synthetase
VTSSVTSPESRPATSPQAGSAATGKAEEIAAHFRRLPRLEPASVAVRYEDRAYTWGELGALADGIEAALDGAGVAPHAAVAWLARNDPALIGGLIGLVQSRHCVAPLNPHQPPAETAEQMRTLNMAAAIGVERDFTPELRAVLAEIGAIGVVLEAAGTPPVRLLEGADRLGPGPFRNLGPEVVIERLTSGTTGEPKRIEVPAATFAKAVELGARSEKPDAPKGELKVKRSPAILLTTFSHSGGMWGALLALNQARPMELFDKFEPHAWADAVERAQSKAANLVPSMVTMVLEAGVEPGKLKSLIAIRVGTAALDPETQRKFEEKYHVPLLVELGASEFMGGIAGWSLADHKQYGVSKRGAVGRPRPDMEVRVTDVETGAELPAGQVGTMNLKSPRAGPDWVKTTDLASLDADGFLYLHGRADEAINRGGFKVLPDKVAEVLRLHPAVREAGVLAVKDARLGQVPVAFVEPVEGEPVPSADELKQFARSQAAAYMVPVAFEFVDALPRTLSLKIDRPALRARFKDKYEFS